jgi:HSP20 family protein
MSSGEIEPFDWSRRFFGLGRRGFFDDMFRGFDQMKQEMERGFEDMEKRIPKDLIREYTTSEGGKVREVGPMVYGYSMTVGPDGKPRIREFGNVKPSRLGFARPEIGSETVEVKSEDPRRKYHRTIEIPAETDIETAKSNYNNGILEITFKKKEQTKGKTIKVD